MIFSIIPTSVPIVQADDNGDILGIDIEVSPSTIPCGGKATVTATIRRGPDTSINLYGGRIRLMDDDTITDDVLDQKYVKCFADDETTVTFTLRCDSKAGGCELYGPSGSSNEGSTDIYVQFYESKSAEIHVQCKQVYVDASCALSGQDSVVMGGETEVIMEAEQPIENITQANWDITYDDTKLMVSMIDIIDPVLLTNFDIEHTFTYDFESIPGIISFDLSEQMEPVSFFGPMILVSFIPIDVASNGFTKTYVKCADDADFFSGSNQLDICMGSNHSIAILPDDTSPPVINDSFISYTQANVTGGAGAISDNYDQYLEYLRVDLYDEDNTLVDTAIVESDGSFSLSSYFWLNATQQSTLTAVDGVGLSTSHQFIPSLSSVSYVESSSLENQTGRPNETVETSFFLASLSDSMQTYDIIVTNTLGWETNFSSQKIEFSPHQTKTLTVQTMIPKTAMNNTENTITLTMTAENDVENTQSSSQLVLVQGVFEGPAESTEDDQNSDDESLTPGFDIFVFMLSLTFLLFILVRKRK